MDDRIDALVATHIMGWNRKSENGNWLDEEGLYEAPACWSPTTNIDSAWDVLEAVDLDWKIEPHRVEFEEPVEQDDGPMYYEAKKHSAEVGDGESFAEATALAICLAALKAKGIDPELCIPRARETP